MSGRVVRAALAALSVSGVLLTSCSGSGPGARQPEGSGTWRGSFAAVYQVLSANGHAWKLIRVDAVLREGAAEPILDSTAAGGRGAPVGRLVRLSNAGSVYTERFVYRGLGGPGDGGGTTTLSGAEAGGIRYKTVARDLSPVLGKDLPADGRYEARFVPGMDGGEILYPVTYASGAAKGAHAGAFIGAWLPTAATAPAGTRVTLEAPTTLEQGRTRMSGAFSQSGGTGGGEIWTLDSWWDLRRQAAPAGEPPPGEAGPPADLALSLAASRAGEAERFRIVVRNLGPAAARDVLVLVTLSGEAVLDSLACASGRCERHARGARCRIASLERGAETTVELRVAPRQPPLEMLASAVAANPDPDASNNFARRALPR